MLHWFQMSLPRGKKGAAAVVAQHTSYAYPSQWQNRPSPCFSSQPLLTAACLCCPSSKRLSRFIIWMGSESSSGGVWTNKLNSLREKLAHLQNNRDRLFRVFHCPFIRVRTHAHIRALLLQFFALVARKLPLLDEKARCLPDKHPSRQKMPLPPFLDLLLKICILAAGLHCSFFFVVGPLGQANQRGLSAAATQPLKFVGTLFAK